MMRYAVVIEKADGNFSAYVPDLHGCVATAPTVAAAEKEIREAIRSDPKSSIAYANRRSPCV